MTATQTSSLLERLNSITEQVIQAKSISEEDALWLTTIDHPHLMDLFAAANRIRHHFVGNHAHICSIVNAKSGSCSEDCGFCSQSAHYETSSSDYGLMSAEQIAKAAEQASSTGSKKFGIVISGRELTQGEELDRLCEAIKKITDQGHIIPDASLGIVTDPEVFRRLKAAGLRQYHHNLETARSHHSNIVTTHDYDDEYKTVQLAGKMGLKTCSGGIFGLGETWAQRIEMAMDLKKLNPETVPLNFLVPVTGTPLGDNATLTAMDVLKICALYRFILPTQHLAICNHRPPMAGCLSSLVGFVLVLR